MKPGYYQPSSLGVLVLLTVPIWIAGFRDSGPSGRRKRFTALILTVVACVLAPTYLAAMGMAMLAALAADLLTGARCRRAGWYAGPLVAAASVTLLLNPAIRSLGNSDAAGQEALRRFAFELFPLHTLVTNWPPDDSTLLVVIALAVVLSSGLVCGGWLSRWILLATVGALASGVLVYITRSPSLAIMFPWRVSVLVVPVAATMLAVQLALQLRKLPHAAWRWKLILLAGVIAVPGLASTVAKASPAVSEAPVAAAVAADPVGVGLIPLATGTLRLNARLPVYIDSMSPPYASNDLVEWWRRVDQVSAFWKDPESFCTAEWAQEIDWMLLPASTAVPTCAAGWTTLESTGEWSVLQRP